MSLSCYTRSKKDALPLTFVESSNYQKWLTKQPQHFKTWLKATNFKAESGHFSLLPDSKDNLERIVIGVTDWQDFWFVGALPNAIPPGEYFIDHSLSEDGEANIALAWGLGSYRFLNYKKNDHPQAKLVLSSQHQIEDLVEAIYVVRDLINSPTNDMTPQNLSIATKKLAKSFKADFREWKGEELVKNNFPAIHAVGRASKNEPYFIELNWGNKKHPQVVLVGKGVCFDSGGLDLKPSQAMRLMKKDMGGAAHVLGLAQLIMQQKLPIQLRLLIPAVENAVSGDAYRPGDVIKTRQGLTVEIGNTDAEGRLILADALSYACEKTPDLIIDFSTLTGAARIALGTDIAVMFSNDEKVSHDLLTTSQKINDPMWRLPLHQPYRKLIESPIADLDNSGHSPYGGAITAALFLQQFVKKNIPWLHFDIMAWNTGSRPSRPEGGEAMGLRSVFAYLKQRYCK